MKQIRLFVIAMLAGLVFVSLTPQHIASAQDGWIYTVDFTTTDGDWVESVEGSATYSSGSGWGNPTDSVVAIMFEINSTVTHVEFDISGPMTGNIAQAFIHPSGSIFSGGALYYTEHDTSTHFEWSGAGQAVTSLGLYIQSTSPSGGNPSGIFITGASVEGLGSTNPFTGEPGEGTAKFKPVSQPDIFFIDNDNRRVTANKQNPNVHSIAAGTIYSITHMTLLGSSWNVSVRPYGSTGEGDLYTYNNLQSINGAVGDTIVAGCVLGLAVTSNAGGSYPVGKLTMSLPDDIAEAWPEYPDSPNNLPCDVASQQTQNCIDLNPNFANNAESWNFEGHVETNPQGVTLFSGGAIYQDVTLDDAEAYTVTIYATTTLGTTSANIDVAFGEATASLHLSVPGPMQWVKLESQALSPGAADHAPDTYRLRIQNTPPPGHLATPVMVKFVCIGTDAVPFAPGDCYFADPNLKTDEWDHDEGVTYFEPGGLEQAGTYVVPADDAIWRGVEISAFVNADTTFKLYTWTRPGAGAPLLGPYGKWHAYIRDSTTLELIQEIGYWEIGPIFATKVFRSFTLSEGENIDGELVIENVSADITSPGWDLKIEHVCLSVVGDVWPGYNNTDTDALLACVSPTQPGGIDDITTETLLAWVVAWLEYGWAYLGYILKCIIAKWLEGIWGYIQTVISGIGLFGVWLGRVLAELGIWAADGARFYSNNFLASLIPIANLVIAWLFGLPFIISIIDAVGLAAMWLQALFDIIVGTFNLFGLIVELIGALLNLIVVAWDAFVAAATGTSSVTFPFPDCNNSASFLYDMCLILDITNFVFSEVPMLAVLVTSAALSMGWSSIRKVIGTVKENMANA